MRPRMLMRGTSRVAWGLAAFAIVACGGSPRPSTAIAPPPASVAPPAVPDVPSPPPSATASVSEPPPKAPPTETIPELARFYAALHGLEDKSRKKHVRVYWMGDSHGQADFWSGAVRDALQARFGDGG